VQKLSTPFDEQVQRDISARLTELRRSAKFDANAICEIKVRCVLKDLLEWSRTLKHDKRRLRRRSQRLLKRLHGTVLSCQYIY
jgi:hypothetical protein